jgi:hypothetical protein
LGGGGGCCCGGGDGCGGGYRAREGGERLSLGLLLYWRRSRGRCSCRSTHIAHIFLAHTLLVTHSFIIIIIIIIIDLVNTNTRITI